MMSKNLRSAQK